MPPESLILPFVVEEGTLGVFTPNMEAAMVLILAEAKRRKLGFLETPEKMVFASKVHYPLWIVPWGNNSLILDGLNNYSTSITYQALPDLETFLEEIEQGVHIRKHFRLSLERHKKTFDGFVKNMEVMIEGLISNQGLLTGIFEYIKESASSQPKENLTFVLAPPLLDAQAAIEQAKQVLNLYGKIRSDIMGLEYTKKVLLETVGLHEQMIGKEIKFAQEAYNAKITEVMPAIEEKIKNLEKKQGAEIAKINETYQWALRAREKEKEKWEHELERLQLQKASLTKQREVCKKRSGKTSLARLEHKLRLCENRIREAKRRMGELNDLIEDTSKQSTSQIEKVRHSYKELIAKEKNIIASLEAQRDEAALSKQRETEEIRLTAGHIANQIEELMRIKHQKKKELEMLARPWQVKDTTLACVPFYLIGYKTGNKTKLKTLWPFKVSSPKGFLKSFRTLLGFAGTKIRLILQSRSKVLSRMLDSALKGQIKSDRHFAEALRSAAAAANVLDSKNFGENLRIGLEELKTKGWIEQELIDAVDELRF